LRAVRGLGVALIGVREWGIKARVAVGANSTKDKKTRRNMVTTAALTTPIYNTHQEAMPVSDDDRYQSSNH